MLKLHESAITDVIKTFLGSGTRSEIFFAIGPRLQKQSVELNQMMAFLYSS